LGVNDPEAIFCNGNSDNLEFGVALKRILPRRPELDSVQTVVPHEVWVHIDRQTQIAQSSLVVNEKVYKTGFGLLQGTSAVPFQRIHHPTLANAWFDLEPYHEVFKVLASSIYIGSFRNAINQGANNNYFDLVIGDALVAQWSRLQAGDDVATARSSASVIRELELTFGFQGLQIIASDDRKSLRVFVNRQPFSLNELGSGVSQFFITIFNLELKRRQLVLIDEPELGLHPQLQLDFLTAVARRSDYGVLYTTHNLGLARTLSDQVYTITRDEKRGASTIKSFDNMNNPVELLGELSFAGNYNLGYHKILLVEGPTEVKLFRRLLQKMGAAHKVTPLSLGGSSSMGKRAVHGLIELRRLSDKVYAIVDSERSNGEKRAIDERLEFERNCKRLGICCHLLELRSVENYFSDGAIKSILGEQFAALGPYDPVPTGWSKALNWKIADAMLDGDFTSPDMLEFLAKVASD
jgi:hypothetical protein